MLPLEQLPSSHAAGIRYILFDIDDTITENGLLLRESFDAIWAMRRAGYRVIPVTGRPAGWCDLIARQWPVDGVVGENGAFAFYMDGPRLERMYHPNAPDLSETRLRLAALSDFVLDAVPGCRIAKDQPYRLFDLAVDFAEEPPVFDLAFAERIRAACEARGAHAKVSSIHVNAWFGDYDKLSMAELFLRTRFGWDADSEPFAPIFFGDSPNDEPMFKRFALSCGVANVLRFADRMNNPPAYITARPYGYGFADACDFILGFSQILKNERNTRI